VPPRGIQARGRIRIANALEALQRNEVEFVIVGGWAVIAHGSQRLTRDLDIVVNPTVANGRRLIRALVDLEAEYRLSSGRWERLSPRADPRWIVRDNHLFSTRAGGIDVFKKLAGIPSWKEVRSRAMRVDAFGLAELLVLDKDLLIRSKLAAGRDQDLSDVAELTQPE
jgi:Nucleotidyltransferase of unknown function (DUF6036)